MNLQFLFELLSPAQWAAAEGVPKTRRNLHVNIHVRQPAHPAKCPALHILTLHVWRFMCGV